MADFQGVWNALHDVYQYYVMWLVMSLLSTWRSCHYEFRSFFWYPLYSILFIALSSVTYSFLLSSPCHVGTWLQGSSSTLITWSWECNKLDKAEYERSHLYDSWFHSYFTSQRRCIMEWIFSHIMFSKKDLFVSHVWNYHMDGGENWVW